MPFHRIRSRPSSTGGGGGGGSTTYNQYTVADEFIGPASYATGGMVVDLSKTMSSLNSLDLVVKKGSRGANLPLVRYETTLNSPSAGKATVKIVRKRVSEVSVIGNINAGSQPAGVTIQPTSGVASSNEAAHTHSIDHDHPSFTSGAPSNTGASVLLNALGPNHSTHSHTLDLPNLTGTSGAGSSHNHQDNSIYQHQHGANQTSTDYSSAEVANATNLSGTTWLICATGVKA